MESHKSAQEAASPASSGTHDETRPNEVLINALAEIDPDQLSPRDALNALYRLKRLAEDSNADQ